MGDGERKLERMVALSEKLNERLERMNARLRDARPSPFQRVCTADDELYARRLRGR